MSKGRGFEYDSDGVNKHHRIAKERGGTNHPDNIEMMNVLQHRVHHILLGNATPIEQLQVIHKRAIPCLIDDCSRDIQALLDFWKKEGREAYKEGIVKKNRET